MENKLPFGKRNYQMMGLGLILLIVGFIVMTLDKADYGFGFIGLTLGPIIVMAGFILEIFAILHRPEKDK
ncbi:MAG TPA: DUF3098 domain-containing protein [Cyclobacteriaceae bacterium]|nr:DUF3098 domain-containing protein [Cyclobacteriaceae bacterium]